MTNGSLEKRIARIEVVTNNEHLVARALLELIWRESNKDEPLTPAECQAILDARDRLLQVIQGKPHALYMDILLESVDTILKEPDPEDDAITSFDESPSDVIASWNVH